RLLTGADHTVGHHLHGGVQVQFFPVGPVGPAVEDLVLPGVPCGQLQGGRPLGAQSSSADGGVGVTLDLDDLFVLDVDVLPTPHRTVGAHGLDHAVRILGARTQLFTPLGLGGVPTPRRVVPGDLSIHRPRLDPRTYPHACHLVPSGAS